MLSGYAVSRAWIEWAHGPCAESADAATLYPISLALVSRFDDLPKSYRSTILTTADEMREVLSVAECYGPGSTIADMGPWWIGYQRKLVRNLRRILREAGELK